MLKVYIYMMIQFTIIEHSKGFVKGFGGFFQKFPCLIFAQILEKMQETNCFLKAKLLFKKRPLTLLEFHLKDGRRIYRHRRQLFKDKRVS